MKQRRERLFVAYHKHVRMCYSTELFVLETHCGKIPQLSYIWPQNLLFSLASSSIRSWQNSIHTRIWKRKACYATVIRQQGRKRSFRIKMPQISNREMRTSTTCYKGRYYNAVPWVCSYVYRCWKRWLWRLEVLASGTEQKASTPISSAVSNRHYCQ
jgi:hypothetical protein